MHGHLDLPLRIKEAYERIAPYIRRTYLVRSMELSDLTGANVFLKCENLQLTGSFKIRGAMNKLLLLSHDQPDRGCVAASTGNHGKAIAFAAHQLGIPATVFAPASAEPSKLDAIRKLGATVNIAGTDCVTSEVAARQFAAEKRLSYVSPYNDWAVIAGQGTLGLEISEQLSEFDAVYASMGGAGMICGVGAYLKSLNPQCDVVGCSPENSQVMIQSLQAGRILDLPSAETVSDGTAGGIENSSVTFELCQSLVDRCVTVNEAEIRDQLIRTIESEGMLVEGAAAVAVAGMLKDRSEGQGKNVVVILCGSNIGVRTLADVLGNRIAPPRE